jgi:hypothetical protein
MQARRFKTLLQTSVLFILPVALIPGQITAAEPADAETTTTTGEAGATESDPGAWDKTREVSGEVWEATKEGSAEAWDKTREVSGEAWEATKEGSAKAWDKTMELTQPEEEITGEAPQAETQEL